MTSLVFLEKLALAPNRSVPLAELTPETEEFFHFNILQLQNESKLGEAAKMLERFKKASGRTTKFLELEMRQRLLEFDDPKKKDVANLGRYLIDELQLNFTHSRLVSRNEVVVNKYLTSLDVNAAYLQNAMSFAFKSNGVDAFNLNLYESLQFLSSQGLTSYALETFLRAVQDPIYDNLVKLIEQGFADNNSFGKYPVHRKLTLEQLDDLAKRKSWLQDDQNFVQTRLERLLPPDESDPATATVQERSNRYAAAWDYVQKLSPSFNSIKVLVMYSRLNVERSYGVFDHGKFMQYIGVPRSASYVNSDWLNREQNRGIIANFYTSLPSYAAVGDDGPLVRDFVVNYFQNPAVKDVSKLDKFMDSNYLKQLLAETKLLYGTEGKEEDAKADDDGAVSKWLAMLDSYAVQQLKERIDLEFARTNAAYHAVGEPVELTVSVKNVPKLVVKVFEINTRAYYRAQLAEVEADINLDGLTPHEEFEVDIGVWSPFRRVRKVLSFPKLQHRRGVFVVELLGNGKNARAVIRKGSIRFLERVTMAGHVFRLFDEKNAQIKGGGIWLAGQTYTADEKGEIIVPFTSSEKSQQIVLSSGDFTAIASFQHQSEQYAFNAGIYVDREALVHTRKADVVVRPVFSLNGVPAPLQLLENVSLKITSEDDQGIESTKTVPSNEFKLDSNQDSVHTFTLPENIRRVRFQVDASVKKATDGETVNFSASDSFSVNGTEDTEQIDDLHLRFAANGYCIFLLGKAGEARGHQPVNVTLNFRLIKRPTVVQLQTDVNGRVFLGPLEGVGMLSAQLGPASNNLTRSWVISPRQDSTERTQLCTQKGSTLRVRYTGLATKVTNENFSLLRTVGDNALSDHTSSLSVKDGYLTIAGNLPAGTYAVYLKELNQRLALTVVDGPIVAQRYVMSPSSFRELTQPPDMAPVLQLQTVELQDGKDNRDKGLTVRVSHATADTRVHVITTHFDPAWSLFNKLAVVDPPAPRVCAIPPVKESDYLSQRSISDEQRYILDRKGAKKYVGNMLERPSLLLNARVRTETSFSEAPSLEKETSFHQMQRARAPGRPMEGGGSGRARRSSYTTSVGGAAASTVTRSLDFLCGPSSCLYNVRLDPSGSVTIPWSQLQPLLRRSSQQAAAASASAPAHSDLTVVVVNRLETVFRRVGVGKLFSAALESKEDEERAVETKNGVNLADRAAFVDTRLIPCLDPSKHLKEQYLVSLLPAGQTLSIDDVKAATIAVYDTLGDAFALFSTSSGGSAAASTLKKFDCLPRWASLSTEEKQAKYSELSCNELNYFIYQKDPEFFAAVVKPYIANKLPHCRTFMDLWLLFDAGSEVFQRFTAPHEYAQLNTAERILLAQKLGGAMLANFGQAMRDQDDNLPKDQEAFIKRFKTAVQTKAMSAPPPPEPDEDESEAEEEEKRELAQPKRKEKKKGAGPPPPPPAVQAMAAPRPAMAMASRAMASRSDGLAMPMPPPAPGAPMPAMAMAFAAFDAAPMEEAESAADDVLQAYGGEDAGDFDNYAGARAEVRQLFRAPESTKEYEENGYYLFASNADTSNLVPLHSFWTDYAAYIVANPGGRPAVPFLSQHFPQATRTFTEMVLALAVLGLPFKADPATRDDDGFRMSYTAASPTIVFHKQVREAPVVPSSVAVVQNYYDPADPYTETKEDGRVDKYIENEFLMNKTYRVRVVLTNVSSAQQKVEVLQQIPEGAMPVGGGGGDGKGFRNKTVFVQIAAYSTSMLEYSFYFPALGEYRHYPVHVSKQGKIIGFGQAKTLKVVTKSSEKPDLTSWKHVSQDGSEEDVIRFLNTQNVHKIAPELWMVAWRFKEANDRAKAFYKQVVAILRNKSIFDEVVWRYGLLLRQEAAIRDYLPHSDAMEQRVGLYIDTSLFSLDPYKRRLHNYLEYAPLINQRAHLLKARGDGGKAAQELSILNRQFKEQYRAFLTHLMYRFVGRGAMDRPHAMAATYYMLLQDRVDEASELFAQAEAGDVAAGGRDVQLQFDYLRAYMDFYDPKSLQSGPLVARSIAQQYRDYPVLKKRKLFAEIAKQAEEIMRSVAPSTVTSMEVDAKEKERKEAPAAREKESRDAAMAKLAASEPSLDFGIEGSVLTIHYQNIKSCVVNVYFMDLELLFSTSPFIDDKAGASKFMFVAPNKSFEIADLTASPLPVGAPQSYAMKLPDYFSNSNAYVEILAPAQGVSRSQPFYSHSLKLQVIENYGQLKVESKETGRAIPKAYVKVYAKLNKGDGAVEFYKDGYTDLRGSFDYASVSSSKLSSVAKFALLVLTDRNGAVVREASPPPQ